MLIRAGTMCARWHDWMDQSTQAYISGISNAVPIQTLSALNLAEANGIRCFAIQWRALSKSGINYVDPERVGNLARVPVRGIGRAYPTRRVKQRYSL